MRSALIFKVYARNAFINYTRLSNSIHLSGSYSGKFTAQPCSIDFILNQAAVQPL